MKSASREYREAMKFPWRNRWLYNLYIGAIRDDFQDTATSSTNTPISFLANNYNSNLFSNSDVIFNKAATFEKNLIKADGGVEFIDEAHSGISSRFYGYVSEELSDNTGAINCVIEFFSKEKIKNLKGLTLEFDSVYPTNFTIECRDKDGVITFNKAFTNDSFVFITPEDFGNQSTVMKLTITKMNEPQVRFRLKHVLFGVGMSFDNNNIILSNNVLSASFNSASLEIPNVNLNVSIDNYSGKYDLDNPLSFTNVYAKNQDVNFQIAYLHEDGRKEKVCSYDLLLDKFDTKGKILNVVATDFLRNENDTIEFNDPTLFNETTTLYDVAQMVANNIKTKDFNVIIDETLKDVPWVFNDIKTSTKDALYNIASAGACRMKFIDKDLYIYRRKNIDAILSASSNDKAPYSDMDIFTDSNITEIGSFDSMRTEADSVPLFPGRTPNPLYKTGYVSNQVSDENGVFPTPVEFTVTLDTPSTADYLYLRFGSNIKDVTVRTYNGPILQDTFYKEVKSNDSVEMYGYFKVFDRMVISVSAINEPHNRLYVKRVSFVQPEYDMNSTYYVNHQPDIRSENTVRNIRIVYTTSTKSGNGFQKTENSIMVNCNDNGYDIEYKNPFVTTLVGANKVGELLKKYYSKDVKYDIDFIGDPTIETNDILNLHNKYNVETRCVVEQNNIVFTNGGLCGKITARRV